MELNQELRRKVEVLKTLISNSGRICITTHRNADPDAIASLIALNELIKKLAPNCKVGIDLPEGLELISKEVVRTLLGSDYLNKLLSSKCVGDYDLLIILDAASKSQLSSLITNLLGDAVPYVVIDHHEVNNIVEGAKLALHYPQSSSTSELITLIANSLGILNELSNNTLTLLIIGILYDTKFLRIINEAEVFRAVYELMKAGGNYSYSINLLSRKELPYPEKVARLKAISRAGIYLVSNDETSFLVAITCIGAYESSVLKVLQDAGADLSIAICKRKDLCRIVLRASRNIVNTLKKPIAADLANLLGKELGGSGGGHASAAGATLSTNTDVRKVVDVVSNYFRKMGYSFRVLEEGRWLMECG